MLVVDVFSLLLLSVGDALRSFLRRKQWTPVLENQAVFHWSSGFPSRQVIPISYHFTASTDKYEPWHAGNIMVCLCISYLPSCCLKIKVYLSIVIYYLAITWKFLTFLDHSSAEETMLCCNGHVKKVVHIHAAFPYPPCRLHAELSFVQDAKPQSKQASVLTSVIGLSSSTNLPQ